MKPSAHTRRASAAASKAEAASDGLGGQADVKRPAGLCRPHATSIATCALSWRATIRVLHPAGAGRDRLCAPAGYGEEMLTLSNVDVFRAIPAPAQEPGFVRPYIYLDHFDELDMPSTVPDP
jgi:hypothetical protein